MPEAGALPIPKKLGSKGLKDMVRHLRRAHERHRVRHRGAACVARRPRPAGRWRWFATATGSSSTPRAASSTSRSTTPSWHKRRAQWKPPAEARARLSAALHRAGDAGRAGLRLRFPGGGEVAARVPASARAMPGSIQIGFATVPGLQRTASMLRCARHCRSPFPIPSARSSRPRPSRTSFRTPPRAAGISGRSPAPPRCAPAKHRAARGGCGPRPSPASRSSCRRDRACRG